MTRAIVRELNLGTSGFFFFRRLAAQHWWVLELARNGQGGRATECLLLEYDQKGFPKRLLAGRSARIIVTMGMPVMLYRWYFGVFGLRGFERSMLSFAGIKPIREGHYGLAFANETKRVRWIEDLHSHGKRAN